MGIQRGIVFRAMRGVMTFRSASPLAGEADGTDIVVSREQNLDRAPRETSRHPYLPYLFLPLTGLLTLWFFYVAFTDYNFAKPQGVDLRTLRMIFTEVPRNLSLFFFLLVFLLSAIGPGNVALKPLKIVWRDAIEETLFSLATGLIVYTFGMLIVGTFGFLQRWVCFTILALALLLTLWYIASLCWRRRTSFSREALRDRFDCHRPQHAWKVAAGVWLGIILAVYLYVALLGGLSPETGFDARYYHLGQARSYVHEERFYNYVQVTNVQAAALDPYQVVLYTTLWKMNGMIQAKLLHWGDALITMLAMIYFCRAFFRSMLLGLISALIFISTPLVTWSTSTAGNDLQLSLYTLLSIHAFLRWRENPRDKRWLVLLGVMSGYAFGSKLIGFFSVFILLFGLLAFTCWFGYRKIPFKGVARQLTENVLIAGIAIFVCCLPSFIRAYRMTGNPVFPQLNGIFHSPYWGSAGINPSVSSLGPSFIQSLITQLWNTVTVRSTYRADLGSLFIIALPVCVGVALFSRQRYAHTFRLLGVFVLLWLAMWLVSFTQELRYGMAVIPVMAIVAAFPLVIQRWQAWPGQIFQFGLGLFLAAVTLFNFQPFVGFQKATTVSGAFAIPPIAWGYLYDGAPEATVQLQFLPMINYINLHLSTDTDKVYDDSQLVIYSGYSDIKFYSATPGIATRREWDLFSDDALAQLKRASITYVSVPTYEVEKIKLYPIGRNLKRVYSSPDQQVLYWIDYAATP
jgi:hypothetical protein